MTSRIDGIAGLSHWMHRHLLKLILGSYLLAAFLPGPGLWIKDTRILRFEGNYGHAVVTLPKMLLSLLLFTAGMRVRLGGIGRIGRSPGMMLAGLAANLAVPLGFLAIMAPALGLWHNPEEAATVMMGLALVTSMPIAGSSTGWAQAAEGDMALSLGLVLGSTLLSPLTTPICLHAMGLLTPGRHGSVLHQMAGRDTGSFLAVWVLLPSFVGVACRAVMGEDRAANVDRRLKLVAPLTLLTLCYANASSCLPQTLARPDWDFLAIIVVFVAGLCAITFTAGHVLSRVLKANRAEHASLIFGLGMNNNGTGLVLASMALSGQPMIMLPIIIYNLTQHVIAGCVGTLLSRRRGPFPL